MAMDETLANNPELNDGDVIGAAAEAMEDD
jgi:hypothetical protein